MNLTESVSAGFPGYSCKIHAKYSACSLLLDPQGSIIIVQVIFSDPLGSLTSLCYLQIEFRLSRC